MSGLDLSAKIYFREYDYTSSPSESRVKTVNASLAYPESVAEAVAASSSSINPERHLRLIIIR